jgi:hypothetical protein
VREITMLAFFGLGTQELILLAMGATLILGVVAAVVLVSRVAAGTRERAIQDEENRRLPDEPDRGKDTPG